MINPHRAGDALRRLVELASHRSGAVLAVMNGAAVTLPQVLLISRVDEFGSASLAELGGEWSASMPALSQMVDRLAQQGWLKRAEDPIDRRRKLIRLTPRARALLRKLKLARSADYELGLMSVSREVRSQMVALIERAAGEIEREREGRRRSGKEDRS
jgi:DNA-binding MarR family transcriptional regulator